MERKDISSSIYVDRIDLYLLWLWPMLEVWAQSGAWPVLWVQVVAVVVAGVSVTAICVGLPSSPLGN